MSPGRVFLRVADAKTIEPIYYPRKVLMRTPANGGMPSGRCSPIDHCALSARDDAAPDWLADAPVHFGPVSAASSLLAGKNTGKAAKTR